MEENLTTRTDDQRWRAELPMGTTYNDDVHYSGCAGTI